MTRATENPRTRRASPSWALFAALLATPLILSGLTPRSAAAVGVETFSLQSEPRIDGLFVARDGAIYGAGTFRGSEIYRIDAEGHVAVVASGFSGPTDLGMDAAGNLYVTNFNAAAVSKVAPDGTVSTWARVPPGPAGLVVEPDGTVYVSQFGAGNGDGNSVTRIAPDGTVSEFAHSDEMAAPIGLARGPGGDLYAANFYDGKIFRIDAAGAVSLFTQVKLPDGTPSPIGHISPGHGGLVATALRRNRLFFVAADGAVSPLSGDGSAGTLDGPFASATFQHPNGIAEAPNGDVYVATAGNGQGDRSTLRRLVFGAAAKHDG